MEKSTSIQKKRHWLPAETHGPLNSPDTHVRPPQARLWLRGSLRPRQIHLGAPEGKGRRTWQRCKPIMCSNGLTENRSAWVPYGTSPSPTDSRNLQPHRPSPTYFATQIPPDALCRLVGGPTQGKCFPSGVVLTAELLHRGQHTGDEHSRPL